MSDVAISIYKMIVESLAKTSLRKEVCKLEKDVKFPIGFYKGLREHGIFVHTKYNFPWWG